MQTQTSNTLHNAIMEAGGKDRPPMLASGNYVQWKSRINRYIDTKPNHELIHYFLKNPPYNFTWANKEVPISEGSSVTTTETYMGNYKNVSQDIRDQLNAEAETVQIILTGIDNDIYSTVDACPNACEMWKAIKRLKQGESINVQDLETNLYWECGKFTSRDGESLESYYSRFYKMMNKLVRNQCDVTNHQVNVQFLLQLQPEWQRNKGKAIINSPSPIYDQEPSMVAKDDEMIGHVVGARETVGTTVVQKSGIKCYNCKEFEHVTRECQKQTEQADWRDDTDDESEDQELEAHYIEQIDQNDDNDDLANERKLLASLIEELKFEIDDNKNRNKFLETSNKVLDEKLKGETKDFKTQNKSLESSNNRFKEVNNKLSETNTLMYKDLKKFQAELERRNDVEYASKVEIECAKTKGDLISYKIESQKSFNKYTQQVNDLNQTISEMKKELSTHQETISILSQAKEAQIKLYKTLEDKELDKVIALENKVKVLDNIVYKTSQSVQTMNMFNSKCQTSFAKLKFFKKAQRVNPRLYDVGCYNDNLALMLAPESNEHPKVVFCCVVVILEVLYDRFKDTNNKLSETNKLMYNDLKKSQAELDRRNDVEYASKVKINCAKAKGDLISYKMESQMSFNKYTQQINDLNQTISEMKKELSAHQKTISIPSQAKEAQIKLYKTRKDKELDKFIALENKVKVLDKIVYKTGQSVQTMNMLNSKCRTSFAKPEFLKKAQRANPRLYDIGCYNYNLALMLALESDEVICLEKESRSKLSDLIRPFDYDKLNNLYDLFVPQREKSSEQRYFSERS
nr:hypothetical protein [Tanacetum cinerariifolium]